MRDRITSIATLGIESLITERQEKGSDAFKSENSLHMAEKISQKVAGIQEKMISIITEIYNERFTESELQQTLDYFLTPAGQKMVQVMPVNTLEFLDELEIHCRKATDEIVAGLEKQDQ